MCGVDIVTIAEIFVEGKRDVATMPPIECPITMMLVPSGYWESMNEMALAQ